MKNSIKTSFLILIFLTLFNCQNVDKESNKIIEKCFGLLNNENDSIAVELNLSKFNNWKELLERTEQIVCNDSIPKISLKSDSIIKRIYFQNPCWKNFSCFLIKEKNIIEIYNDTINKSNEKFYSLDSLAMVLKRDIDNNGQNPSWSDNPEKLLIYISYDNYGIKKLSNTLNLLTQAFEQVTDRSDLKIILDEKVEVLPILQPPPPLEY